MVGMRIFVLPISMDNKKMKIAIIILNYNSSNDCQKCVSFLKRQEGIDTEIIIVDNASPRKGEREVTKKLCKEQNCTFIAAKENQGYNAGNNIGLRYASSKSYKYALIANPDMEFPQVNYLRLMTNTMETMKDVVVMGNDIVSPEGLHQNPMKKDGNWRNSFLWIKVLHHKAVNNYDFIDNYQESHYCSKVGGCCLLLRMNFIKKIGFFDENVFLYCEEAILSKQVEQAHKKMYYLANVQALHRHINSQKGDPIPRFKSWIKSRLYFERHYNYQGRNQHIIKIINWKIYECLFLIKTKLTKSFTRNT